MGGVKEPPPFIKTDEVVGCLKRMNRARVEKEEKGTSPHVGIVSLERRGHPRFTVDLPIEYYQVSSSPGTTARAINASEGGLMVYLPERVEIGQHLQLKLFFISGSDLNTIEMLTEVVWIDIHLGKGWGDYRFGVKFIDVSLEHWSKLQIFLRSLSE